MATEFTVELAHRPGTLAEMAYALEEAGITIEALHGSVIDDQGIVSFITDDSAATASRLEEAGFDFDTREVLIVNVLNKPGSLAELALVMADAGINIEAVYVMSDGHVVLAVNDLTGAIEVTKGMAVLQLR